MLREGGGNGADKAAKLMTGQCHQAASTASVLASAEEANAFQQAYANNVYLVKTEGSGEFSPEPFVCMVAWQEIGAGQQK